MRGRLLLQFLTATLIACGSQREVGPYVPPHTPVGSICYRLVFTSWSPEIQSRDIAWFMPPDVVALTHTPVEHPAYDGAFRVLPDSDPMFPDQRIAFAEWRTTPEGDISLLWGNGFTGVRVNLSRTENGLEGTGETFSDAPGGVYRAIARASSVSCPASSEAGQSQSPERAAQQGDEADKVRDG